MSVTRTMLHKTCARFVQTHLCQRQSLRKSCAGHAARSSRRHTQNARVTPARSLCRICAERCSRKICANLSRKHIEQHKSMCRNCSQFVVAYLSLACRPPTRKPALSWAPRIQRTRFRKFRRLPYASGPGAGRTNPMVGTCALRKALKRTRPISRKAQRKGPNHRVCASGPGPRRTRESPKLSESCALDRLWNPV